MVTADTDKFPISLDHGQAQALFDTLESDGQADAKQKTTHNGWTHGLKASFASLPRIDVKIAPSITELSPAYLLKQANDEGTETRSLPKLDTDFAVAAAPLKTNGHFTYPVARTRAPAAPQRKRAM